MEANYLLLFSYVFLSWAMLDSVLNRIGGINYKIVFFCINFLNVLLVLKNQHFLVITVLLILATIYFLIALINSKTHICYLGKTSFLIYTVGYLIISFNVLMQNDLLFCFGFACFILVVGLKFFNNTNYFGTNKNVAKSVNNDVILTVVKGDQKLTVEDFTQLKLVLTRVQDWFESSKCYLNTEYSIDQLEKDISIDKKVISRALNKLAKMNFYNFLAHHRISYAKEILKDNDQFTLESLSNECGFYSKSSFNKYFKLFVGSTPSHFKLNQ